MIKKLKIKLKRPGLEQHTPCGWCARNSRGCPQGIDYGECPAKLIDDEMTFDDAAEWWMQHADVEIV